MTERITLSLKLRDPRVRLSSLMGGGGYGKTWAMIALAKIEGYVLISLNDADPHPLSIANLIHERLEAKFGPHVQSRLSYALQVKGTTPAAVAAAVRHDLQLYSRANEGITVMLDNTEQLNAEGRLFIIGHLIGAEDQVTGNDPHPVRWIVAMRSEHNLPVRTLRPRMTVQEFTSADLAFCENTMREMGLNDAQIARTQGWPAAVVLASLGDDPAEAASALLSLILEDLLKTLRCASLLPSWRPGDPAHVAMGLRDGWIEDAKSCGVPCVHVENGVLMPHSIVREVLERDLRLRPSEYAAAQRGLAFALQLNQPLTAVEAYLEAGDQKEALNLLSGLLPGLLSGEQIRSALPLLKRIIVTESSPLYLALAQAMFDSGNVAEGLQRAQRALAVSDDQAAVHKVLGRMRLRTGNMQLAATHLRTALNGTPDEAESLLIHAQLALALALHARSVGPTLNTEALNEAQNALEIAVSSRALPDAELLARTALVIVHASRGMRDAAHDAAITARESARALSHGHTLLMCLTHLAAFFADEGMFADAKLLLDQATEMHVDDPDSDSALLLLLARARLNLRQGDAGQTAMYATQAANLAEERQHTPGRREALIMLAVTGVLPVSAGTNIRFSKLSSAFGHEPEIPVSLNLLDDVFIRKQAVPITNRGYGDLPLEVRAVLAIAALHSTPDDTLWHVELDDLRCRMGQGAIAAYTRMMGIQLSPHLSVAPTRIVMRLLRPHPEITIDGKLFDVRSSLLHPLLALFWRTQLHNQQARDLVEAQYGPAVRKNALNHLRNALRDRCKWPEGLYNIRGEISLASWVRHSDIIELDHVPFASLVHLYQAPVLGHQRLPPMLEEMRVEARSKLHSRMQEWQIVDAQAADEAWDRLLLIDPQLADVNPTGASGR